MNREELEQVIKAACANLDEGQVIVFGSQSILGTYDETELPEYATLSREVDVFPRSGIDARRRRQWWRRSSSSTESPSRR